MPRKGYTNRRKSDVEKKVRQAIQPYLQDLNDCYMRSEELSITNPRLSDLLAQKGEMIEKQIEAMKVMAQALDVYFNLVECETSGIMKIVWIRG